MDTEFVPRRNAGGDARRAVREAHIELVRKLLIRGINRNVEIQAYFSRQNPPITVTDRTITRYKTALKKRNAAHLREHEDLNKTIEQIAVELKEDYQEIRKELWGIYHHKDTPAKVKVTCLVQIKQTAEAWVTKLQDLGFIDKAPERHQLIGANGQPIDPPATVNVNVEQLNADFTSFLKARYQDPIGFTNTHETLNRKDDGTIKHHTQAAGVAQ